MTADKILKKYEDDNEYHFHTVDRKWIIEAMEQYAALRQPPVMRSLPDYVNYLQERLTNWSIAFNDFETWKERQ